MQLPVGNSGILARFIPLPNNRCFVSAGFEVPVHTIVGVLATGTNVIDLSFARQVGICVTNVPGYSTDSVVQLILGFMLHFSSMVSPHNDAVHRGDWENSKDFSFTLGSLNELSCMTIGIVGLGAIGRKLAAVADAIGMRIVAAPQSSMNRFKELQMKRKEGSRVREDPMCTMLECPSLSLIHI